MSSNNVYKEIKSLIKFYGVPKVYIDTSYISRDLIKNSSFKKITKIYLNKALNAWLSPSIIISTIILNEMKSKKVKGNLVLSSSIYSKVAQDPVVYSGTDIKENIIYSIIKSSIDNFVKNAAVQFGSYDIRVNSVLPGGIINKNDINFKKKKFFK